MRAVLLAGLLTAIVPSGLAAATPDENLGCAIWSVIELGSTEDPDQQLRFGYAFHLFVGLYEGQTGKAINDAMVARTAAMTDEEYEALGKVCPVRMEQFAERMSDLENRIGQ